VVLLQTDHWMVGALVVVIGGTLTFLQLVWRGMRQDSRRSVAALVNNTKALLSMSTAIRLQHAEAESQTEELREIKALAQRQVDFTHQCMRMHQDPGSAVSGVQVLEGVTAIRSMVTSLHARAASGNASLPPSPPPEECRSPDPDPSSEQEPRPGPPDPSTPPR